MGRTKITLTCPQCGQTYEKDQSEYTRNQKIGRISYCSLSCVASARKPTEKQLNHSKSDANKEHLKKIQGNRRDEFTPFRMLLKTTRQRKKHDNDLDLEYLKELWDYQNGKCPYTNIQLQLPKYSDSHEIHPSIRASIDRIDSSQGYIKGNIQYVSTLINYMKNSVSHQDTIDFIALIVKNKS